MPASAIARDGLEDVGDEARRDAERGLVEEQHRGARHHARGRWPASAARRRRACRPPASCARRGAGRASTTSSIVSAMRRGVLVVPRAELEVLAHGEVREDGAALGHQRDAGVDHVLGRRARPRSLPVVARSCPPAMGRRRTIVFSVVVLPAPLAPIIATISPRFTSRRDALQRLDAAVRDGEVLDARSGAPASALRRRAGRVRGLHASSVVSGASAAPRSCRPCAGSLGAPRLVGLLAEVGGEHLGVLATSSGVPWAMVSPWSRTWISSHTPITTCMLCSTSTTVRPNVVAEPADLLLQALGLAVVHAGGGLVEEQELRARASWRARSRGGAGCRRRARSTSRRPCVSRSKIASSSSARGVHLVLVARRRAAMRRSAEQRCALALVLAGDEHVLEHGELAEEADVLEGARDADARRSARGLSGPRSVAAEADACRRRACRRR